VTARAAHGKAPAIAVADNLVSVRRVEDRAQIRSRLEGVAAYAAYALAYLDPQLFPLAEFYEARLRDRSALVMHARGGLGPSSLVYGDPRLLGALLQLHPGARNTLLTCEPQHTETALATYHLWRPQIMLRMRLDANAFAMPSNLPPVRRLTAVDAADLNRLYALEGDGIWYSGRQVSEGVYYGAFSRGRLIAAAGTHIRSRSQGIAVVGNIFTHPDFRGHGLGTAVTAVVTSHLVDACNLVVLSVDAANRAARKIYERLGYREAGRLVEAMSTRRHPYSLIPLAERAIARWRSGEPGVEAVPV
jgi:RimJ/RimL family protein N-acetyltransferase